MSTKRQHEIAVGTLLVFSSPVELTAASAQGYDTAVGEWHGEDLVVRTDYGLFADPLTGYQKRSNRQTFEESIDGLPARGVAFDEENGTRFTAVHFHDLGPLGAATKNKLTFVVISSGSRTADEALRIVKSIRFRR